MNEVWNRLEPNPTGAVLRPRGTPVAAVLERLEAGESPRETAASLSLDAIELIAALAFAALGSSEADAPPLVQAKPRRPRLAAALSEPAWTELLPGASRPARLALAAGLLQIHDFWDASHEAAQAGDDLGETELCAYWHGIAHRREPDPGNAAYWFRRVGRSLILPRVAEAVLPVLEGHGDLKLTDRLVGSGTWNPFAFVDLCSAARPGSESGQLARAVQRLEMIALLGETTAVALGRSA
jgi:hypothetical protein